MILSSCSSDDDDNSPGSIIGVWKPLKETYVCSGNEEVTDSNSCEQTSRLTFLEDGTLTALEKDDDNESGNCESFNLSATWALIDGDLTSDGNLTITGEEVGEEGSVDLFFEVSNNTLKLTQSDTCGGENPSTSISEFERVE
ncbi:MAG: hypothetical protein L3J23_09760 [Flavobacteriaceae bacterium]|nr:hypothetical protein [Flavobacteriaceae bacterium]